MQNQSHASTTTLIRILDAAARRCQEAFNAETLEALRSALSTYREVVPAEDQDPAFGPCWAPPGAHNGTATMEVQRA